MSAPSLPSWDEMHYRLVSLWDFMQKFDAGKLLDAVIGLSNFGQSFVGPLKPCALPTKNHEEIKQRIEYACRELEQLGLASSLASARALRTIVFDEVEPYQGEVVLGPEFAGGAVLFPALTLGRYKTFSVQMQDRVRDELCSRISLIIPTSKASLYEPNSPIFGKDVDSKFKRKARYEISEASKCLALARPTACVFHLMRTIEVALEAMRLCLGISAPKKGQHKAWGAALDAIKKEMEARENLAHARQWTDLADRKFFDEVYMALVAIKDGCRDDTMHVESTYTEDEATHLFALTKGFMQKVAFRLDENGQPLA